MRTRWTAAVLIAALALVPGCGPQEPEVTGPMVLRAEGVARVEPPAGAPVARVAEGIAAFGHSLGAKSGGGNWVVSPMSIAYALAMARAGAKGDTAAQIDKVFGFPTVGLHEAFNSITRQVVTAETPPPRKEGEKRTPGPPQPPIMCVGNALFPQRGFTINEPYLRTLAQHYGAGVYPVDFKQGDAAKAAINEWARQQTADRIKKVFDSLSPDIKLVLANTVFLKADWEHPFADATVDGPFHRADGSTVQVPTMSLLARVPYAEGDGWRAVELPYGGGQLAMRILLPTAGGAPNDLLSPDAMAAVSGALKPTHVDLSMPRWDFASEVNLKDALTGLGVRDAFDQNRAEFPEMSPTPLYIDDAIHRANITVDEWGTEAAAVSAVGMAPSSAPPPGVELRLDRPFAFAIVHAPTGVPVFIGHVADPSVH